MIPFTAQGLQADDEVIAPAQARQRLWTKTRDAVPKSHSGKLGAPVALAADRGQVALIRELIESCPDQYRETLELYPDCPDRRRVGVRKSPWSGQFR